MLVHNNAPEQLRPTDWLNVLQDEREAAVSQERLRFANELHDTVASGLQTAILHLAEARQSLLPNQTSVMSCMDAVEGDIRACWRDARRCAAAFRPVDLDRLGLAGALTEFARRVGSGSEVSVRFSTCGTPRHLPAAAELALFRAGQEAVTNALRHAHASAVSVELSYDADAVRLDITDNGRGFDVHDIAVGSGLLSIRDRAVESGAELSITSGPATGTQVIMALPCVDGTVGPNADDGR